MGSPKQVRADDAATAKVQALQQFQTNTRAYETAFEGFKVAYQNFDRAVTLLLAARAPEFSGKPILDDKGQPMSAEDIRRRYLTVTPYDCQKEVQAMFAAIGQLNKAAEPFIGKGKILIPVSGKDLEAQFTSLLNWLNADWTIGETAFKAATPPLAALDQPSMQVMFDRLTAANIEVSAQRASLYLDLLGGAPPARVADAERPAPPAEGERKGTPGESERRAATPHRVEDPLAMLKHDIAVLGSSKFKNIRGAANKFDKALATASPSAKTVMDAKKFVDKYKKLTYLEPVPDSKKKIRISYYDQAAREFSIDTGSMFAVEGKIFGDFKNHPLRSDLKYLELLKDSEFTSLARKMWAIGDHARYQYLDALYVAFTEKDSQEQKAKLAAAAGIMEAELKFNVALLNRAKAELNALHALSGRLRDERGQPLAINYTQELGNLRAWLSRVKSPPEYRVVALLLKYIEAEHSALQAVLNAGDGDHKLYLQARNTLIKKPPAGELGVALAISKFKDFADAKLAAYKSLTVNLSTENSGLKNLAALRAFRNVSQNVDDASAPRFVDLALASTSTVLEGGDPVLSIAGSVSLRRDLSRADLVNAALGLAAIAELELAIKTTSLHAKGADVDAAKALLARAKKEYQFAFGDGNDKSPVLAPTYHSNTAVSFAEAGLRLIYPDSKLEPEATYVILNAGENPSLEGVKAKGIEGNLQAAAKAGERYFTFLGSLKDNGIASPSPYEHYTVARDVPEARSPFELKPSKRTEGLPLNSDLHPGHEPKGLGHRYYGVAYQEFLTQLNLNRDTASGLPNVDLHFDGLMASSTSEKGGQAFVSGVETQRVGHLDARLNATIKVEVSVEGKVVRQDDVRIADLPELMKKYPATRDLDPRISLIVERAKEIRRLAEDAKTGSRSPLEIRANIRALENAIESLGDAHLGTIKVAEPKKEVPKPPEVQLAVSVTQTEESKDDGSLGVRGRASVPALKGTDKVVTHLWFAYRTEGNVHYLMNPRYRHPSQTSVMPYAGVVLRGVSTATGKHGDFVIAPPNGQGIRSAVVRGNILTFETDSGESIVRLDALIPAEMVALQLKRDSIEPILSKDTQLERVAIQVAPEKPDASGIWVPGRGKTDFAVIVITEGKEEKKDGTK